MYLVSKRRIKFIFVSFVILPNKSIFRIILIIIYVVLLLICYIWGLFYVPAIEGYISIFSHHCMTTHELHGFIYSGVKMNFFYLKMIETHYKAVVKGVIADNAPELRFTELLKKKEIIPYHSCPETP